MCNFCPIPSHVRSLHKDKTMSQLKKRLSKTGTGFPPRVAVESKHGRLGTSAPSLHEQVGFGVLDDLLERLQELGRLGAHDNPVVGGQVHLQKHERFEVSG